MMWYGAVVLCTVLQVVSSDWGYEDDDKWIWGTASESNEQLQLIGSTANSESRIDPCPPYNTPIMPDFNAKGRRISTIKCYEYAWQKKARADLSNYTKNCGKKMPTLYVTGGHEAGPGEYPNMGAIGWKAVIGTWIFKCGSSLISNKFVLTAAHCSSASPRDTTIVDIVPKIVRFGLTITSQLKPELLQVKDFKIHKIFVHPQYAAPKKYYDIALMELKTDVVFSELIQPACLYNFFNESMLKQKADVAGWGVFESGGYKTSPKLLAAEVDLIDSEKCERLLKSSCNRNWCGIKDHQLCAGKLVGGVDTCQGDSGGPLMMIMPVPNGHMNYLIGVTSAGVGCGLSNLPGIYTRVYSFLDWIEKIVWN